MLHVFVCVRLFRRWRWGSVGKKVSLVEASGLSGSVRAFVSGSIVRENTQSGHTE